MSLNHIVLQGRLTRDVEIRKLPSGKSVASVSIACDRDFAPKDGGERETDFIDIVAFGSTADFFGSLRISTSLVSLPCKTM